MAGQWKEVVKIAFTGERFRDHALDLSALDELRQFQKVIAETAKVLWKKANPDRERLPRNFEDRTRLCLRRIEVGSTVAPLEVYIEESEQYDFWEPEPVEVNEAIDLTYRVFEAVREDLPLPDDLPKDLLSELSKIGQSLSDDEALKLVPPGKNGTLVTKRERDRLAEWTDQPYEDEVDATGHVLEVDVRQQRFQLWLDERTNLPAMFTTDQEEQVTTALKEHAFVRLRVQGRGEFTPQGNLKRIVQVNNLFLLRESEEADYDSSAPAIEDVIADIFKDVPDEEWERLPHDLTDKLDVYLYGGGE